MLALCTWRRIPILAGPLLKAKCPIWDSPPPPSPIALPTKLPSSCQHDVYLHTDDINTPNSSSVGHSNDDCPVSAYNNGIATSQFKKCAIFARQYTLIYSWLSEVSVWYTVNTFQSDRDRGHKPEPVVIDKCIDSMLSYISVPMHSSLLPSVSAG